MKERKGIILAGGYGTRLYPLTLAVSKQMLPVYNKPMIYYPLSLLMLANIREILIISTPRDIDGFKRLLGDGKKWGIHFEYKEQIKPNGIAEAFLLGEDFIGDSDVALVLGDNILIGENLSEKLEKAYNSEFATVFGYPVKDPRAYGVIELDKNNKPISIEEKPEKPKSNFAVLGLYFFSNDVIKIAKNIKPSKRGELEITSIIEAYMEIGKLKVEILKKDVSWFDAGTHDGLLEASNFVRNIEKRENKLIASPEKIAFNKKWIDKNELKESIKTFLNTKYGQYIDKNI